MFRWLNTKIGIHSSKFLKEILSKNFCYYSASCHFDQREKSYATSRIRFSRWSKRSNASK
ncbi:hypothetical protein THIOM_001218 [Candidatus Thiomargarita nelsonii]|uniref:Uncharacterized protein n=1 Tax=Candidatus Thiomargarita nelsonii TaxID=1003181 RepID=A0A176S4T1_9GAMM|nr:hypothetical protein THIOM_001218 [Candidatus Thiomargarita nelsonii]